MLARYGRRQSLMALFAIAAIGLAAQVDVPVPGSEVPQSLQTLAVALVALLLTPGYAALALVGYLLVGAVGVPVFADGSSGWEHLVGPTSGYLAGFAVGAVLGALWVRRFDESAIGILGAAFGVHVVVLGLGWARLAVDIGAAQAFQGGVSPFLFGGVVKSLAAASIAYLVTRVLPGRNPLSR